MRRARPEIAALRLWAGAAGLALWAPAVMVPAMNLPFQPLDLVVLAGWPLIAVHVFRAPPALVLVLASGLASILLSWAIMGGVALVLAWTLLLGLPFVALMGLAVAERGAAAAFLHAFLLGAAASLALFAAQIALGAETLDFRTNIAFRLPPHFGRGFALFPEVSTYAAHGVIAFAAALALGLHRHTRPAARRAALILAGALALSLPFTQSSSLLVILPALTAVALAKTTRASLNTLILGGVLAVGLALLLAVFLQSFYAERLASASAGRSASMRLASLIGGLSVLTGDELFGVGIGQNDLIRYRAFEVARSLGLSFGALPDGVNAQAIGRVFEEGWPAVLHLAAAGGVLAMALRRARTPVDVALICIAAGSALVSVSVIGYRGVYTNWLWLGIPAAMLAGRSSDRPAGAGSVGAVRTAPRSGLRGSGGLPRPPGRGAGRAWS